MATTNTQTDIKETIESVRRFTLAAVKPERYAHSVRTAEMAKKLCGLYGIDESLGYLAGIGHDMCKDMKDDLLLALAAKDGNPITPLEQKKPPLLHGRAAAVKMREDFGIRNEDVLQAVACHTFGGRGICPLAKVLYVADKIEPGRDYVTKEYLDRLYKLDLNTLVATILQENVEYLEKKGKTVALETLLFLDSLKSER